MAKATLFGVMLLCLVALWSWRDPVVEAYTTPPSTLDIRLSGVDLSIEETDVGPSPFEVPAAPDTRRRPLAVLFTTTTTTAPPVIEMEEGDTTLKGTVVGPDGPAVGAVVRIERHTSEGLGSVDVRAGATGEWIAEGLPGGRYRVRAWLPGLATTNGSSVFFADAESEVVADFALQEVDPAPIIELLDGGPIYERTSARVAVEITQQVVDADGLVATTPVIGSAVSLVPSGEVALESGSTKITGADGLAWFDVGCRRTGSPTATARFGAYSARLSLPACKPVPPSTTTTTTAPPSTPATTAPATTARSTTAPATTGRPATATTVKKTGQSGVGNG